jgi:hypothetical protein
MATRTKTETVRTQPGTAASSRPNTSAQKFFVFSGSKTPTAPPASLELRKASVQQAYDRNQIGHVRAISSNRQANVASPAKFGKIFAPASSLHGWPSQGVYQIGEV